MNKDEALKVALNVLRNRCEPDHPVFIVIKVALEAKDEPVACVIDGDLYFHHEIDWEDLAYQGHGIELLYTTPPQRTWVALTDEEISDCMEMSIQKTCRAIEAKLKEKNT